MADDDKQVEIEVALRDTASATLRSISREIDNITRKLVETGRRGNEALDGIRRKGSEAGGGAEKAAHGVDQFSKSIGALSKSLAGPLGLAAALLAVGKTLTSFAQHRVELTLLTTDLGLTATKMGEIKQILMRKGLSEDSAKQFITTIAGQLQDLRVRDVYSDFYRRLSIYETEGGDKLGERLLASVKSGNISEAFDMITKHVNDLMKQGEQGKLRARYFAREVIGRNLSDFTDWEAMSKDLVKTGKVNEEEAARAHREAADLAIKGANIKNWLIDTIIHQLHRLDKAYNETTPKTPATPGAPAASGKPATPGAPGLGREQFNDRFGPNPTDSGPNKFPEDIRPGKQSDLGTSGATDFSSSNRRVATTLRDIEPIEKETNLTLISIRDTLDDLTRDPKKNLMASLGGSPTSPGGTTSPGDGGGPAGAGGAKDGGGGGSGGLTDNSGKKVDPVTVGRIQEFAARGDTAGMRRMMTANGYRVDGAWCGDVTRVLVGGSGFPVPKGYPIASKWRSDAVGEVIGGAGINEPGRSFGSLTASKTNVPIGSLGGHVMTVVPGTYDPKTNSAIIIDTGGRRRRSLRGFEVRWAGKEAEERAAAARAGQPQSPAAVQPPGAPQAPPALAHPSGGTRVPSFVTPNRDAVPSGVPQSPRPAGGGSTVRASWFDDKVTASGQPRTTPGIALPSRATLGQWFYVRDENTGKEILTQQTDVGPAKWTKRGIDINAPLAKQFGYPNMKSFPTDTNFSYRPALDKANARGGGPQSSRRDGKVQASVDFGAMKKVREAGEIFVPIRTASFSQGTTVTRNSVLPGSSDYSRWTA